VGVHRPGTLPASAAAMANDAKHPVIVHIVSRDQTITVRSGEKGLLYSLTAADGKVMIADATPDKFAQLQPELYRAIRGYIAVKTDNAPVLYDGADASVDAR
jgi:hypothetical protein